MKISRLTIKELVISVIQILIKINEIYDIEKYTNVAQILNILKFKFRYKQELDKNY